MEIIKTSSWSFFAQGVFYYRQDKGRFYAYEISGISGRLVADHEDENVIINLLYDLCKANGKEHIYKIVSVREAQQEKFKKEHP